jgi:hypothetical protein
MLFYEYVLNDDDCEFNPSDLISALRGDKKLTSVLVPYWPPQTTIHTELH